MPKSSLLIALLILGCRNKTGDTGGTGTIVDGGTSDAGTVDGGITDGGIADGGKSDGGTPDGGTTDGGKSDGGIPDGGTTDGGKSDGGTPDGGTTDGGTPDGGTTDGGKSDGGTPDGGTTDGGTPDGGTTDGGTPDGGTTDGGADTGGTDAGGTDAGGTDAGGTDGGGDTGVVIDDADGDGYTVEAGDCDDGDATSFPGASELDDLADNDCDGFVDEDFITAGDIIVNEIMLDPSAVSDIYGEWFELRNDSDGSVDLVNWQVVSSDGDSITIDSSLVVPADGFVVLGVDSDTSTNGGVSLDYVYDRSSFSLSNDTDSLVLYMNTDIISEVEYTSSWDIVTGYSLGLDAMFGDASTMASSEYWCAARQTYGWGDYGTPGGINSWCTSFDHDGDGYTVDTGDCLDSNAYFYPGATEIWNGYDNNCDDLVDNLTVSDATGHLDGVDTDYFGWQSALSTGDFNGDGQLDVAVGGTYVNSYGTGGVYVVDGTDYADWDGVVTDYADSDIDGGGYYGYFGTMDQQQGDIDGDGIADLLVAGTDSFYGSYYGTLAAGLFLGGAFPTGTESTDADIRFVGSKSRYTYVKVLNSVDFDGDGADDIFYGDYVPNSTSDRYGYVYYFSGADLSSGSTYELDGDSDATVYGENNNDYLGYALGGADLNGDGYGDVAVAASAADDEATDGGVVYLVRGRGTFSGSGSIGFAAYAAVTGPDASGRLGRHGQPQFADYDGDGNLDMAVSATDAGKVYIFYSAGDLSGETSASTADIIITGAGPDYFGIAMDSGDLDGDGLADLAVGASDSRTYSETPTESGQVYVFAGSELSSGDWTSDDASATFSDDSATGLGFSLAIGDITGDGQDDLLTAAPFVGSTEGSAYLFVRP